MARPLRQGEPKRQSRRFGGLEVDGWHLAILAASCLALGSVAGCGGDGEKSNSANAHVKPDLSACLERAGANVAIRTVGAASRFVEALLPDGDQIFIGRLPSPAISERAIQTARRARQEGGLGGILTASTLDRGSVLILVVGRQGVRGGVAAVASEQLARRCAIETDARIGRPSTLADGTDIQMRLDQASWTRSPV